jgi:hypothetical protein
MGAARAAEDLGQTIRLATPVSSSIVTNTTALVLLDQHNTGDRQRPVDRQMGGVGGDNQVARIAARRRMADVVVILRAALSPAPNLTRFAR